MTETVKKPSRRNQILQALATMLEQNPGARITTAGLARQVGVSEAALYRHFPSKAKMFESLIEFIETTVFSRVSRILNEEITTRERCGKTLYLLLTFAERNPGISRILAGDALSGESDRLRQRIAQFYDRLETQLRQALREAEIRGDAPPRVEINTAANLLLAATEGRINQFVRSNFTRLPTEAWEKQWRILSGAIF
ncbi:MAG: nucleoid occlusion factor SlmA [Pseudomonadales bacterium]|jgi:TetR/AcrR family transcriptional regulator|nr:nucleoid occlusion factor SlmA [Pseudomonadales bacterium]MDP7144361.1 nucleoid occlusion factor SlmA [Pseudomonadales bacterium]MDP7359091.1 nucleoid occlusion factor SlmA [Pseudomonadales bacterium]HJN52114.1 nucleoid occlusion factor SlmA [Pseudomonadales bacterium]|tara:strand:+ start:406 stop:996 length:591 start_codon:yes stop_codon:yes gene_type:complete